MSSDTVGFWMQSASRVPLLTAAQEITLGTHIRDWLDSENPDSRTIRRGKKAKERFIRSNLKLVISVAKRFTKRITACAAVGFEDLLQEGCIGLARAAEKFDPAKGYKFSTYAYWWISQSVARSIQVNLTTIKVPLNVQDTARRWRYRPSGQTLEEFAAEHEKDPRNVMDALARFEAAQPRSLDAKLQTKDGEASTLLEMMAAEDPSIDDHDFVDAMAHLHDTDDPMMKDALAMLELNQEAKPAEMAELLGCSIQVSRKRLNDMRAVVREHCPTHIRAQICREEKTEHVKIEPLIPRFDVSPIRELVAVSTCSPALQPMSDVTQNGHQSLEAEAALVISEVRSEAVAEEPAKATKRRRRSAAEIKAEKVAPEVALSIDGVRYEGQPEDIAAVIKAIAA